MPLKELLATTSSTSWYGGKPTATTGVYVTPELDTVVLTPRTVVGRPANAHLALPRDPAFLQALAIELLSAAEASEVFYPVSDAFVLKTGGFPKQSLPAVTRALKLLFDFCTKHSLDFRAALQASQAVGPSCRAGAETRASKPGRANTEKDQLC